MSDELVDGKTCNCFNEHLERLGEKVIADILPENADRDSLHLDWSNKVFRLDGKSNNVMLKLNCEYHRVKKDGTRYRNKTNRPITVAMSFCPFCGTEY